VADEPWYGPFETEAEYLNLPPVFDPITGTMRGYVPPAPEPVSMRDPAQMGPAPPIGRDELSQGPTPMAKPKKKRRIVP